MTVGLILFSSYSFAGANCDALQDTKEYRDCLATEMAILRLNSWGSTQSDTAIRGEIKAIYHVADLIADERVSLQEMEPSQ